MTRLLDTPRLAAAGWTYAAWVAVDLRLLLFLALIAVLGATGLCILFVRRRRPLDVAAVFFLGFVAILVVLVAVFNGIAHYPVFRVESFFPFP
ncbi:MAG: hypothetical protein H6744_12995 [Deltaproteobacteria bacterium]|nr:hypothetical protein [Deltaproteobacteria bacterium]